MSAVNPLGGRVTRKKKHQRKYLLRPAVGNFMIQIRVRDEFFDFSGTASLGFSLNTTTSAIVGNSSLLAGSSSMTAGVQQQHASSLSRHTSTVSSLGSPNAAGAASALMRKRLNQQKEKWSDSSIRGNTGRNLGEKKKSESSFNSRSSIGGEDTQENSTVIDGEASHSPDWAPQPNLMKRGDPTAYAAVAAKTFTVLINDEDTPTAAIQRILDHVGLSEVHKPEDLMLCQCFADFSIDYSHRGIYGTLAPMKEVLSFPFFLSLQVIPYVVRINQLVKETEPAARAAIIMEQKRFGLMCKEYSHMLLSIHNQRSFLVGRELDARMMKKEQERRAFFDLSEVETFRQEHYGRLALLLEEENAIGRLGALLEATLEHQRAIDSCYSSYSQIYKILQGKLLHTCSEDKLFYTLQDRMTQLVSKLNFLCDDAIHEFRSAYTLSRIGLEVEEGYEIPNNRVEVVRAARKTLLREGYQKRKIHDGNVEHTEQEEDTTTPALNNDVPQNNNRVSAMSPAVGQSPTCVDGTEDHPSAASPLRFSRLAASPCVDHEKEKARLTKLRHLHAKFDSDLLEKNSISGDPFLSTAI